MEPLCDWIRLMFWIISDNISIGKLSKFPADVIYISLELSAIRLCLNTSLTTCSIKSIPACRYLTS